MPDISDLALLNTWEQALHLSIIEKGIVILGLLYPDLSLADRAKLSIGERDARLLLLRDKLFGKSLTNTAICPSCNNKMEWSSNTNNLLLQHPKDDNHVEEHEFIQDGYRIKYRLPNSEDISQILDSSSDSKKEQKLLGLCISNAEKENKDISVNNLPREVLNSLNEKMEKLDPQADIRMNLTCSSCEHSWETPFDIISYLWMEINNWARIMLREVAILAKSFGWSELDILNMSPFRRQIYLELINE